MFAASSIASFFNLFYQLAMLKVMPREQFASLNSLVSLLVILSVPAAAFTAMVTKHVSTYNARKKLEHLKAIWRKLALHTFCFSLSVFILIVFFRQNIALFLHLDSFNSIVILGLIFFFTCISSVVTGGLQGLEKFKWLALIGLSAGFLKVFFSLVLVKSIGDMLLAGLIGFLLPTVLGILFSLWPLRFLARGAAKEKVGLKGLYLYVFPVLMVSLCFALVTNVDLLLVKHFFFREAQDYSVAQMVGKIILSIPGAIYMVMFSRASSLHALNTSSRDILKRSLTYTFILSFSAVALYNLFPGLVFKILAAGASEEVILLGRLFSLSMLFYALSNVLCAYQLSIERYGFIKTLVPIVILQIIAICLFHQTTSGVLGIMLAGSLLIFVLNVKSALYQRV